MRFVLLLLSVFLLSCYRFLWFVCICILRFIITLLNQYPAFDALCHAYLRRWWNIALKKFQTGNLASAYQILYVSRMRREEDRAKVCSCLFIFSRFVGCLLFIRGSYAIIQHWIWFLIRLCITRWHFINWSFSFLIRAWIIDSGYYGFFLRSWRCTHRCSVNRAPLCRRGRVSTIELWESETSNWTDWIRVREFSLSTVWSFAMWLYCILCVVIWSYRLPLICQSVIALSICRLRLSLWRNRIFLSLNLFILF